MGKKKTKIFDIDYLINTELSEDDLYDIFETNSLKYSLIIAMYSYVKSGLDNINIIDQCKTDENWIYKTHWTKKQRNHFESKLIKAFKNIYQYSDYRATVEAQHWLFLYGFSLKNNKVDKKNMWK